jgi:hypothetical protein
MARSRSDSRSDNGSESKTPLVVALVFFVLATLILGVTTYLGFSGEGEAKDNAAKAEAEKTKAVQDKDKALEALATLKVAVGTGTDADLNTFRSMKYANENQQVYNDFMTNLGARAKTATTDMQKEQPQLQDLLPTAKDIIDWDFGADHAPPKRTLIDQTVRYMAEKIMANNQAAAAEKGYKAIQDVATKAIGEMNKTTKDAKDQIEALPEKILTEVKKIEAQKVEQQKMFTSAVDTLNDKQKSLTDQTQKQDFTIKRQQDAINLLKETNAKQKDKLTATEDPFAYDKPQGKILSRKGKDKVVEINLGSSDNVKPGLRFSVQPSDTVTRGLGTRLKPVKTDDGSTVMRIVSKGSIEVVEVLGPSLSTCRITDETDEIRDGILRGDLLYNSVWRKGAADHVALVGIFDMDGDGVDDIVPLVTKLNKAGIVVDAYWDFASNKWVGELNERTQYLVEGYAPSVHGIDANTDAKAKMTTAIQEAKKQANDRGMTLVKLREFFPRIGFDVNLGITDDRINQAAARYYQAVGTSNEGGEGK